VDQLNKTATDQNMVAAPGLGSARTQQQTGKNRRNGSSPVSQRPRRNESDHVLTTDLFYLSCTSCTACPAAGQNGLRQRQKKF
jgi:hypothetical protein